MKRLIPITFIISLFLCGCEPTYPPAESATWLAEEHKNSERMPTDLASLAASYTNVSADVWQWENELWQLSVVKTSTFVTAIYVGEVTVTVQGDTFEDVADGLEEYAMKDNFNILLKSEPFHYLAHSDVEDVVDGWGTRTVGPYTLPWPENAISSADSWQTDDTTFIVVEGAKIEPADEQVADMIKMLETDELEGATLWYVEEEAWQGLAWKLQDTLYVSIGLYDDWGMRSIISVQLDDALAERYGVAENLSKLLSSEPLYQS